MRGPPPKRQAKPPKPRTQNRNQVRGSRQQKPNPLGMPESNSNLQTLDGIRGYQRFRTEPHSPTAPSIPENYAGKPIVINFWFPSCPPCRAELEHFEEVYQEFGQPSGSDVQFVGIQQLGLDSIEDGAALFDEIGVTFPGLPDNDTLRFRSRTTSSRIQRLCF